MKKIFVSSVVSVCAVVVVIFLVQKFKTVERKPPPQKTTEEIMQERADKAGAHLQTTLGQAITKKDWDGFSKIYNPQKNFIEYAEIIRALYVESKINAYSPIEQQKLLHIALDTFEKLDKKSYSQAGLLVTQIQRLPAPVSGSAEFKQLEHWYTKGDSPDILKRIALHKCLLQSGNPDVKFIQGYIVGIKNDPLNLTLPEYIYLADDIRSPKAKKIIVDYLTKSFTTIKPDGRPAALSVMAKNLPEADPQLVRHYTFAFLKAEKLSELESAMRAIPYLFQAKALSPEDRQKIGKRLNTLPREMRTPFIEIKTKEIIGLLSI